MIKENKNWSQYEDKVLKTLREDEGLKKWSVISQKMEEQFKIIGKSGKKCRERYQNHLNKDVKRDEWTEEEELALFRLHNEKGNKWVEIARALERSDNAVKNHYHSKLRKALRKINCLLSSHFKNEFKSLKNNIISKVLQTAENYLAQADSQEPTNSKLCYHLKNKILNYLSVSEKLNAAEVLELRTMVKEINQFNKIFKKKAHSKSDKEKENLKVCKYKGKQILNLINENKNKTQQINKESSEEEHSESEDSSEDEVSKEKNSQQADFSPAHQQQKYCHPESHDFTLPVPMGHSFPSYPFSFFGNPCPPNIFNIFSYNYLVNSREPINPFSFWRGSDLVQPRSQTETTIIGSDKGANDWQNKQVSKTCQPREGL